MYTDFDHSLALNALHLSREIWTVKQSQSKKTRKKTKWGSHVFTTSIKVKESHIWESGSLKVFYAYSNIQMFLYLKRSNGILKVTKNIKGA